MLFLLSILCLVIFSPSFGQDTSHSYSPRKVNCPSTPLIRSAGTVSSQNQALSPKEASYVFERRKKVLPNAYREYLNNVESSLGRNRTQLPGYVKNILLSPSDQLPRVSAAISGGGLRASFVGAGILNALDARNKTSAAEGTGGLLQVMDYITGLSGGACLVMSMAQANYPGVYELTLGLTDNQRREASNVTEGWLAHMNFVAPASLTKILENPPLLNAKWWLAVATQVKQKALSGFDVSLGDIYSRILAYHFVNGTTRENFFDAKGNHGIDETLSDIGVVDTIKNHYQPFPIITAIPNSPGQGSNIESGSAAPLTNNQYEFNMYESGSWDSNLATFVQTSYLGSALKYARPPEDEKCVNKFDNLGFLIATSSNIFRKYDEFATAFQPLAYRPVLPAFKGVLSLIPNPFYGLGTSQYLDQNSTNLALMDGSFGGENIPFAPLLVPARKVDIIFAFDASADDGGWASGVSLKYTSIRSKLLPPSSYPFPQIPEDLSQIDTSRPTFFGCDEKGVPLIIYVPNSPPTDGSAKVTNLPTEALQVSESRALSLLEGGAKLATRGISNDPFWPACLACAVVDRNRERLGQDREGICADCFERYCFDRT